MSDKNILQNTISDELKEVDNPFKLIMSLGKILSFLNSYIEDLSIYFKELEDNKWDLYWLIYDLLNNELEDNKKVSDIINNQKLESLFSNVGFKRWIFETVTYVDYLNKSELEKNEIIKKFYSPKEEYKNIKELVIELSWNNIKYQLSSDQKWKNYHQIFIKELKFLDEKFVKNINRKDELHVQTYFKLLSELNTTDDNFIDDLKSNINNKEIKSIISEYKISLYEEKNSKVLSEYTDLFFKCKNEVEWKVKILNKLNNLSIILNKLNNTIFSWIIFSYIIDKIQINNNINYKLIEKLIFALNIWKDNSWIIKFFTQLNDRQEKNILKKILIILLQNIILIIFVVLLNIFLPIYFNILLFIFLVLNFLKVKIKSDFMLYRINTSFRFFIIALIILSIFLQWVVFHFDNFKIYNLNDYNKYFLRSTSDFFFWKDSDEIKKCYNFDYIKEWKSCFEKENDKK